MAIKVKIQWIALLLVAFIGIICVYFIDVNNQIDDSQRTIEKLDSAKQKLDSLLWRAGLERDSLNCVIDSIALSRKVVIEKIKAIPVIIPNTYDGLSNKQLEKEMIKEYMKSKNK